jgi:hypothetical protein
MTTLPTWLRVAYFALLGTGALAGWAFVVRYMATYKWWSTELGRHLVVFSADVSAWFTFFLAVLIWPEFPGKTAIQSVLFVVLVAAVVWRFVMFERLRRKPKGMK